MFEITIVPSVLVFSGLALFILVQYRRHRWLNNHPIDTWRENEEQPGEQEGRPGHPGSVRQWAHECT